MSESMVSEIVRIAIVLFGGVEHKHAKLDMLRKIR